MTRMNLLSLRMPTFMVLALALIIALPPVTAAPGYFPFFTLEDTNQDTCGDCSFASVPLKDASTRDCINLMNDIWQGYGYWTVGGFSDKDQWQTVGFYDSCTLAFKATRYDDGKDGATWVIGNNDTYHLVADAIVHGFSDGKGAVEGVVACQYVYGGYSSLMYLRYRVWDSRGD